MNNIQNEFKKYFQVYDRSINDLYQLPYSYEDLEIQPNELAIASTLNIKLEQLYKNFIYLFKLCNIVNYDIPGTYTGWYGITGTNLEPLSSRYFSLFSSTIPVSVAAPFLSGGIAFQSLGNSKNAVSFITTRFNIPALIAANNNTITFFRFDGGESYIIQLPARPESLRFQSIIDPLSGSLKYQNITGLAFDTRKDTLYVADGSLNNIYSYLLDDTIVTRTKKFFLLDFVGGKGTAQDNSKFDGLNKITFGNNVLFAEDTRNRCIKCFDPDFNWINTTVLANLFDEVGSLAALAYCSNTNSLLAAGKTKIYSIKIDSNYRLTLTDIYDFSKLVTGGDEIIDIKFANYDSNIVYILTKDLLIKKWITKLNETIGIYPVEKLSKLNEFKWMVTFPSALSADNIFISNAAFNLSSSNLAFFQDSLDLVSLLRNTNFVVYSLDDILINKNEYNQAWIYNKAFKKLFFNHTLLKSNIGYRFYEGRTVDQLLTFIDRQYNTYFLDDPDLDTNIFVNVCVNENFQSSVLNRNIKKIYDYQFELLTSVVNQENIRKNLLPSKRRGNNVLFEFVYYNGGDGITLTPNNFKMYSNSDGFITPDNSATIDGLAPYLSGAGIIII